MNETMPKMSRFSKQVKKIPYGLSDYERLIKQDYVFVDKTKYIETLENMNESFLFFLRPRRFGKSLFISTLQHYYGIQEKKNFHPLFGNTYIGKNPTLNANTYHIIKFDFSKISTDSSESTFDSFNERINKSILDFNTAYKLFTKAQENQLMAKKEPADKLDFLFSYFHRKVEAGKIYILIDEYDHFANEIIAFNFDHFSEIVSRNGYVRKFYEAIKAATGDGIVERMFVTGVTPVTLDSLTSGFNIASNVSLEPHLNEMMGFTEEELRWVIRETCEEGKFNEDTLVSDMASLYNGSLFHPNGKARLYNSDMALYFLSKYTQGEYKYPEILVDSNIASDYGKIKRFMNLKTPVENAAVLRQIIENEVIDSGLTRQYSFERDFTAEDFISLLFYNGLLTVKETWLDRLRLMIPNYVIKELYWRFFADHLRSKASLSVTPEAVITALEHAAQNNDMAPLAGLMETIMRELSNRDLMQFDEKHLKIMFVVFLSFSRLYRFESEAEYNMHYPDLLLLFTKQFRPNYQFLIEFKYIKKRNKKQLEKVIQEAHEQVKGYRELAKIKQLEDLKCWIIVFAGEKLAAVEESKG